MRTMKTADDHYAKTHELLDAARTAMAGNEINKAIKFLIEAVEQTTFGWGAVEPSEDEPPDEERPHLPNLRTIMVQGTNCVSVLNEYAQRKGIEMPQYEFEGSGPFKCSCHFLGKTAQSSAALRTKNEAKHDAAVQMLQELRGDA